MSKNWERAHERNDNDLELLKMMTKSSDVCDMSVDTISSPVLFWHHKIALWFGINRTEMNQSQSSNTLMYIINNCIL